MLQLDTLTLVLARRQGGGGCTAHDYLDFHVSGVSLLRRLAWENADLVSCLGWGNPNHQAELTERLLLRRPPELTSGRHMLYVCGECGDIGCGAITVAIRKEPSVIVWSEFGFENNYEDTIHHQSEFASIGPYFFDRTAYWQAFQL